MTATPRRTATSSPLTSRRKYLVLAICCSSLFLVSLDGTIVNVALPSIARELDASISTLQWTIDAYLLVLATLLLLSGSLADRLGRKRAFLFGLAVFTAGSLLSSLAVTDGWLIVFRMLQAVGGSAMTPVALAIVTNMFTGQAERARAIGLWAAVSGVGIAAGPLIGGFVVDASDWRAIFWINIPTGVAAFILTAVFVPESRSVRPRPLDPVGQVLVVVFLASLVFAIIEGPRFGWLSPAILASIACAAVAVAVLIRVEGRRKDALIPLDLFRTRSFVTAFVVGILGFAAFGGLLFANTLYLQDVRGLSASLAGVLTLPLAVATIVCAPLSGRLLTRYGVRLPLLIAGACIAVGALLLVPFTPTAPVLTLLVPYAIFGAGYGMLNAPVNDTAVSELPDDRAGVAASLISTAKQVGSALGVAVVGTMINVQGSALDAIFQSRSWLVWVVVGACGVVIFALVLPRVAVRNAPTEVRASGSTV